MAKWQIFKDSKGEYRARLKSNNGQTIVWTEGYVAKQSAKDAIDFVKANANCSVEDLT